MFELLKATAIGRQDGFEEYKKALNFVALNYPNSDEGKQAQHIYSSILPKIENTKFIADDKGDKWKLVYKFSVDEAEAAQKLKATLDKALSDLKYTNMETSIDYYDPQTALVIVHGLNTLLGARGFGEVLNEKKEYKIERPYFEISSPNYKIVQIHKNLEDYIQRNNTKAQP